MARVDRDEAGRAQRSTFRSGCLNTARGGATSTHVVSWARDETRVFPRAGSRRRSLARTWEEANALSACRRRTRPFSPGVQPVPQDHRGRFAHLSAAISATSSKRTPSCASRPCRALPLPTQAHARGANGACRAPRRTSPTPLPGATVDDVLDAHAALWTARRAPRGDELRLGGGEPRPAAACAWRSCTSSRRRTGREVVVGATTFAPSSAWVGRRSAQLRSGLAVSSGLLLADVAGHAPEATRRSTASALVLAQLECGELAYQLVVALEPAPVEFARLELQRGRRSPARGRACSRGSDTPMPGLRCPRRSPPHRPPRPREEGCAGREYRAPHRLTGQGSDRASTWCGDHDCPSRAPCPSTGRRRPPTDSRGSTCRHPTGPMNASVRCGCSYGPNLVDPRARHRTRDVTETPMPAAACATSTSPCEVRNHVGLREQHDGKRTALPRDREHALHPVLSERGGRGRRRRRAHRRSRRAPAPPSPGRRDPSARWPTSAAPRRRPRAFLRIVDERDPVTGGRDLVEAGAPRRKRIGGGAHEAVRSGDQT